MAIEIITRLICDVHIVEQGNNDVEGVTIEPVTVGGRKYTAELCEACMKTLTYQDLRIFLVEHGRDANAKAGNVKAPKTSKVQVANKDKHECRFCERKDLKSNQARVMHERRSHPVEFEEAAIKAEQEQEQRVAATVKGLEEVIESTKAGDIEVPVSVVDKIKATTKQAQPA